MKGKEQMCTETWRTLGKYGVLFLLLVAVHAGIRLDHGDDLVYAHILDNSSLWEFLKLRYDTWSSRLLIEAVMVPLTTVTPWVWRILDSLVIALLIWNVSDLFDTDGLLFALMLCTIPLFSLNSAGWITTTTNYLWPLSLGLVALRPWKHWLKEEPCRSWEYAAGSLCLLYGANMEQMCALLLGFYLVFGGVLLWQKKKLPPFYLVQLLLLGVSLGAILLCTGNACRTAQEIERFFPEFAGLGNGQKLLMGFLETMQYYLAGGDQQSCFVFAVLAGAVGLAVLQKKKQSGTGGFWMLCAGWLPFFFYWGIGQLGAFLLSKGYPSRGRRLIGALALNRQLPELGSFPAWAVTIQVIVYLLLAGCVLYAIYALYGWNLKTWMHWLLLAAGFLSRLILGFSPTIYASGDRTALFASVAILIVALHILQDYLAEEKAWVLQCVTWCYVLLCVVANLA